LRSVSEIAPLPFADLADVVRQGEAFFRPHVAGRRFAVRASRRGVRDLIPFSSHDVEDALGRALLPHSAGVDLGSPEVTAHVEMEPGTVHFFLDKVAGHGGLPLGVEGRAVALVSGGFDSAVAAWLLLKRGVQLEYVFINLGGAAHRQGVLEVMRVIARRWSYGSRPRLHEVDLRPVVAELTEKTSPRYWQILLKRLMLHAAETIARQGGAAGIVTGDAIGQVSSQTVQNLAVISQAARLPILRPLLGFNKEEILALARQIGIYDAAAEVAEYCGLQGRRPATRASLDAVLADEAKLEPDGWRAAVAARTVHDLRALPPAGLTLPPVEIEVDGIPPGATVLDLRSGTAFLAWHYPEALHLELPNALAAYSSFDRDRTYVLVCEVGLKSAHLAERMQAAGFRAYHLKGGARALLRLAEREGLLAPGLLAPAVR
ncbi:MAG TPA: THUMP domain-containing protein, partial [Thermoanaerobaculia bacterium]|nr:THUMP domain-containing protein [Thermoanaerobaculia bacterium]